MLFPCYFYTPHHAGNIVNPLLKQWDQAAGLSYIHRIYEAGPADLSRFLTV